MGHPAPPSDDNARSLESLRAAIDAVDQRLVALLNERGRLVVEIGELKRQSRSRIYAPSRETEVFQRVD